MKVIFVQNIPGVATKGDVRNVKEGYYRNLLMPRQLAVHATPDQLQQWEEVRKKMLIEKEQLKSQFEELTRRLKGGAVKIEKKVTAKGTLYGGVKAADISKAIKEQLQVEIAPESLKLPSTLKSVGSYDITVMFHEGVNGTLKLVIDKKE